MSKIVVSYLASSISAQKTFANKDVQIYTMNPNHVGQYEAVGLFEDTVFRREYQKQISLVASSILGADFFDIYARVCLSRTATRYLQCMYDIANFYRLVGRPDIAIFNNKILGSDNKIRESIYKTLNIEIWKGESDFSIQSSLIQQLSNTLRTLFFRAYIKGALMLLHGIPKLMTGNPPVIFSCYIDGFKKISLKLFFKKIPLKVITQDELVGSNDHGAMTLGCLPKFLDAVIADFFTKLRIFSNGELIDLTEDLKRELVSELSRHETLTASAVKYLEQKQVRSVILGWPSRPLDLALVAATSLIPEASAICCQHGYAEEIAFESEDVKWESEFFIGAKNICAVFSEEKAQVISELANTVGIPAPIVKCVRPDWYVSKAQMNFIRSSYRLIYCSLVLPRCGVGPLNSGLTDVSRFKLEKVIVEIGGQIKRNFSMVTEFVYRPYYSSSRSYQSFERIDPSVNIDLSSVDITTRVSDSDIVITSGGSSTLGKLLISGCPLVYVHCDDLFSLKPCFLKDLSSCVKVIHLSNEWWKKDGDQLCVEILRAFGRPEEILKNHVDSVSARDAVIRRWFSSSSTESIAVII